MKYIPKIIVEGICCSGKSTIINIIRTALIEKGFNIKTRDLDGTIYPLPIEFSEQAEEAVKNRIGDDSIFIVEQQIARTGFTKEIK